MAVSEEIQEKMLEEAISATPNYTVDMNGEQFKQIDADIENSKNQYNQTVGGMIDDVDGYYSNISNTLQENADKQAQIQQENTDFLIEKIEQQKDQANKDYIKEQSGAYVDWQKQSNKYGVEAEKMASAGLTNTGFSESSQVSMYNTYQNRVATARETLSQVILNYNNNIKEAQLQNNAALAQIYSDLSIKQAELALEGALYKNQLIQDLANKQIEFDNAKWNRYQDMLQQINTENALKENIRQFTEGQKFTAEQNQLDRDAAMTRQELQQKFDAEQAELNRKHAIELEGIRDKNEREQIKIKHENEMAMLKKQQEYELEQLNKELANQKAIISYSNSLNKATISGATTGAKVGASVKTSSGSNTSSIRQSVRPYASTTTPLKTEYYKGYVNADATTYGTFSNGYQPKGIAGYGKVSKTGKTIQIKTETLSGKKQTVVQNVWKTPDGSTWYWEGRANKYLPINTKKS